MEDIRENIKKWKKTKEFKQMDKETSKLKEKLEEIKRENGKMLIPKQPKSPFVNVLESDQISIDEARAYYIVICKKKPKHDSIQTKNFLLNEIKKKLEQSKTK